MAVTNVGIVTGRILNIGMPGGRVSLEGIEKRVLQSLGTTEKAVDTSAELIPLASLLIGQYLRIIIC